MIDDVRRNYLIFLRGGKIQYHPKYVLKYWVVYPNKKVGSAGDKNFYDKYLVKK